MQNMADVVRFAPGAGVAQGEGNRTVPISAASHRPPILLDGVRDDAATATSTTSSESRS